MEIEQILKEAHIRGFKLDLNKSDELGWIRFTSIDDSLDEKELRWIWYNDVSDKDNLVNGDFIKKRLIKKKQIQKFLKY